MSQRKMRVGMVGGGGPANFFGGPHRRAILLDNNRVGQYITLPREEFLRRWRGYGGWATTPVYSPAAPPAWK